MKKSLFVYLLPTSVVLFLIPMFFASPAYAIEPCSPVETATSTESVDTTPSEPVTEPAATASSTPAVPEPPRYDLVRFNEVYPNPIEGKEWIEVVRLNQEADIRLEGLTVYDNASKIFTFTDEVLNGASSTAVIELSSARLNNDGDTLTLKDPNGNTLEVFAYEGSEKGSSWARNPDGTGDWELTPTPTPGTSNAFPETSPEAAPSDPAVPSDTAEPAADEPTDSSSDAGSEQLEPEAVTEPEAVAPVSEPTVSVAVLASKTTKPTAAKTAKRTTKKNDSIYELPMSMTHDEDYGGMRVRLHGTVGSMPGLLSGHGFILLSPEGRGIRVSVPTAKKLPTLGIGIAVTGRLTYSTNDLPYLKLVKEDTWVEEPNGTPLSRDVNMLAPSNEDAWSLVTVEGAVADTTSNKALIDVDGNEIAVFIKGPVGYRAARLTAGDLVQVTGLLELDADGIRILPRSADEIALLRHVEPTASSAEKLKLAGWVPFGAAGLAVVGSEGFKNIRARRKRKALEDILLDKEDEYENQPS